MATIPKPISLCLSVGKCESGYVARSEQLVSTCSVAFTCTKALYDLLSSDDWRGKGIKKQKEVTDEDKQAVKNGIDRLKVDEDSMSQ